jgi:hypothetical protein
LAAVLRIGATPRPARHNAEAAGDETPLAGQALRPSALYEDAGDKLSPTRFPRDPANERWLTAAEVSLQLRRTRAWVYKRAKSWSFVTRPSRKTLLISQQGLNRWLERH